MCSGCFNCMLSRFGTNAVKGCKEEFEMGINMTYYYMALSHKDWELPNSRIWLAKMDIDRGLDFPI